MIRLSAITLVLATLLGLGLFLTRPEAPGELRARISTVAAVNADDSAGFARVTVPRPFVFPQDHGPHPEYQTEWWYYTGNLDAAGGRHFGFQLTFFRFGLTPKPAQRSSEWAASSIYMAHFALADVAGQKFYAFERFSRGAAGLAGAQGAPFRVWLEDWAADGSGPGALPMRLRASQDGVAIDLTLEGGKPVVLQGDRGLSHKSPEPGNASYYYSLTRMPTRGALRVGQETFDVAGLSWMDREWSTSALGPDQVGWDWFALQLDDARDVMVYRLRRRDGTIDAHSAGALIAADGATRPLAVGDVTVDALDHWTSPRSGVRYPSRWRLAIADAALTLEITPRLADQELIVGTRYWEGAVRAEGTAAGRPVGGRGYVELVGYGE